MGRSERSGVEAVGGVVDLRPRLASIERAAEVASISEERIWTESEKAIGTQVVLDRNPRVIAGIKAEQVAGGPGEKGAGGVEHECIAIYREVADMFKSQNDGLPGVSPYRYPWRVVDRILCSSGLRARGSRPQHPHPDHEDQDGDSENERLHRVYRHEQFWRPRSAL